MLSFRTKSSGRCCAVISCQSSGRRLREWKDSFCEIHVGEHHVECPCLIPYGFHQFPRNDLDLRCHWIKAVNRKLYVPGKHAAVCSRHFIDGRPTKANPVPSLHLGYEPKTLTERKYAPGPSHQSQMVNNGLQLQNAAPNAGSENDVTSVDDVPISGEPSSTYLPSVATGSKNNTDEIIESSSNGGASNVVSIGIAEPCLVMDVEDDSTNAEDTNDPGVTSVTKGPKIDENVKKADSENVTKTRRKNYSASFLRLNSLRPRENNYAYKSHGKASRLGMVNLLNAIFDALQSWLGEIKMKGKVICDNEGCGQTFSSELEMLFHWVHCTVQACYTSNGLSFPTAQKDATTSNEETEKDNFYSLMQNLHPVRRNGRPRTSAIVTESCYETQLPDVQPIVPTEPPKRVPGDCVCNVEDNLDKNRFPPQFTYSRFCNICGKNVRKRVNANTKRAASVLQPNAKTTGGKGNETSKFMRLKLIDPKTSAHSKTLLVKPLTTAKAAGKNSRSVLNSSPLSLHQAKNYQSLNVRKSSSVEQKEDDFQVEDYVIPDLDFASTSDIVTVKTEIDSESCCSDEISSYSQEANKNIHLNFVSDREKPNVSSGIDFANAVSDVTIARDQALCSRPSLPLESLVDVYHGSRLRLESLIEIDHGVVHEENNIRNKVSVDSVKLVSNMLTPLQDFGSLQLKSEVEIECDPDT